MKHIPGLLLASSLVLAGADQTFDWKGPIASGQSIEIKGVNGAVRASASTSGMVEVHAVKHGRKNNPDEVKIEVLPHAGGVTVCSVYPNPKDKPNECKPGNEGRNNVRDNDVKVDFEVRVPAGVRLAARTVNGGVEIRGLDSDVSARTVNGRIDVSSRGNVDADTVNGSIQASMGETSWQGERKFSTVNGSITVELPSAANTEVQASTVNGDIQSDLPLIVKGKFNNRSLNGTLGSGGRALKLSTVNGSVKINRRS